MPLHCAPRWHSGNLPANAGHRFNPWVGKIPWSRKWQPAPVFLSGKFHGQRGLVGYSLIPYGEQCSIHDLRRRFNFGTRDQAWSLCFCIAEFYSSIKRDRENFWHRHQKGDGESLTLLVLASYFMSLRKLLIRWERHLKADGVSPGHSPTMCIFEIGWHEVYHPPAIKQLIWILVLFDMNAGFELLLVQELRKEEKS